MGFFDGVKECQAVASIVERNGQLGEKVCFDNLVYIDGNDNTEEILYIVVPNFSAYYNIIVSINDEEKVLWRCSLPIITLVYLMVQKMDREYNA
jgi:hypothetical protein